MVQKSYIYSKYEIQKQPPQSSPVQYIEMIKFRYLRTRIHNQNQEKNKNYSKYKSECYWYDRILM
jgi:hypothetical protein